MNWNPTAKYLLCGGIILRSIEAVIGWDVGATLACVISNWTFNIPFILLELKVWLLEEALDEDFVGMIE